VKIELNKSSAAEKRRFLQGKGGSKLSRLDA
jgi:hypothetical protein